VGLIKSFKRQTWRFSGIWNLNRKWRGVGEFSHFQIRTGPGGSQTETPPPLQVSQVSTDRNNNKNLKKEFVLWLSDLPSRGCLDSLLYLREFPSPKFAKTYKDLITRVFFFFFFFLVCSGCDVLSNNTEIKNKNLRESSEFLVVLCFIILWEASGELFVPLKVKRLECSSTNLLTDRLRCLFSCANRNPGCVWFITSYRSLGTNNLGTPCNRFFLFNSFL